MLCRVVDQHVCSATSFVVYWKKISSAVLFHFHTSLACASIILIMVRFSFGPYPVQNSFISLNFFCSHLKACSQTCSLQPANYYSGNYAYKLHLQLFSFFFFEHKQASEINLNCANL